MNQQTLEDLQARLFFELGYKVDIYHSEKHKGVIVVPNGKPLHPLTIIKVFNY